MGGRGASSGRSGGAGGSGGSSDGVIMTDTLRTVESFRRTYPNQSTLRYHKHEVLEASTDGEGNVTFRYATADSYEKVSRTTTNMTYHIKAGAVDGETFNINWDKVKSISGQTYKLRESAKKAGLTWDSKRKMWIRLGR